MNSNFDNDINYSNFENHMVSVPSGEIDLRDDRTKQTWKVILRPFLISKFPVTQEFYINVIGVNPSTIKEIFHPVETVAWKDAILFCNTLSEKMRLEPCYLLDSNSENIVFNHSNNGYRLPTEAEWEYACKAGTKSIRYGELRDIAWYHENSQNRTHAVGLKEPNDWGLYDMLGNVWEWCSDVYDEEVYGTYRILKGGGWADEERSVMATNRRRSHPLKFKIDDLGFRIARNL